MTEGKFPCPNVWLSLEICETTYSVLQNNFDWIEPLPLFETRIPGRLESILGSVKQTFFGQYLNDSVPKAMAAYFVQIARGHPLLNGNKRMAVLSLLVFAELNGYYLDATTKTVYEICLMIVTDVHLDTSQQKELLTEYFSIHLKKS